MLNDDIIESLTGKRNLKKSRVPARLDFLQSATGLVLAIFIVFHLLFEGSILFGKESMYTLSKFFEGDFLVKGGSSLFIILLAIFISLIFVFHAFLAMRKFPKKYREFLRYRTHAVMLNHEDTNLWFIQVSTGFMLFFLGSIHLYTVMTNPMNIGPYASSDRVYSDYAWILYLMLLVSVVLHTMVGLYRLAMKWGWFDGTEPRKRRKVIKRIARYATLFYLLIGLLSLASYIKIGYDHKDQYGQRYTPAQELNDAN